MTEPVDTMTPIPANVDDARRTRVRRTALRAALVAVAVYAAFLLSAWFGYAGGHR